MSTSPPYPVAKSGENTNSLPPAEAPATLTTDGETASTNVLDTGETFPLSLTDQSTNIGKQQEPPSVRAEFMAGVVAATQALSQHRPVEILFLFGAADLITAQHDVALDPGVWVLARWLSDEEMDGKLFQYGAGG